MTRQPRKCLKCSRIVTRSKTGMCRRHAALAALESDDVRLRRLAALREAMTRPEVRAKAVRSAALAGKARLAWCPLEYRDDYRAIAYKHGMTAAEGRRMIEDRIAVDTARYLRTGVLQRTAGECAHR